MLLHHRRIWDDRPLLRAVYRDLYDRMIRELSPVRGPTVEIGAGGGNFKEFCARAIATDITWCSWLDLVADAMRLPFAHGRVANLVMFDVFHHLPYPTRALAEMQRVLAPGGRAVLCEPYVSWLSWLPYRFLHAEPTDCRVRPLSVPDDQPVFRTDGPWASNQAIPTVLFWRNRADFESRFPLLTVRKCQALSVFVYPLSGGFERHPLLPRIAWRAAWAIERCVLPLARWCGFRCLVVLERRT